jgi:hypothetical protein
MKLSIAQLRAAGVTDRQIVDALQEAEAEHREKNRIRQRNHRARNANNSDARDGCDRGSLTTLPLLNSTLEKEERSEIVALAARPKYPPEFEEFYRQYPRHEGKRDAHKVWLRVKVEVSHEELLAGAMRYAADPNRDPTFTKHCATWLNKGCWSDGPLPPRGGLNGRTKETPIEQAQRLADEWTRRERAAGIYGAVDDAGSDRSRG